jgi:hypothetical protein
MGRYVSAAPAFAFLVRASQPIFRAFAVCLAPESPPKDSAETPQPRHSVATGRWQAAAVLRGLDHRIRRSGPGISSFLAIPECRGHRPPVVVYLSRSSAASASRSWASRAGASRAFTADAKGAFRRPASGCYHDYRL